MADLKVFQLKIHLIGSKPLVWRRVEVPTDFTFTKLHRVIQIAMGWRGHHKHKFRLSYDRPLAASMKISEIFDEVGCKVQYEYDFGNRWEHQIRLEKIVEKETGAAYPRCIAGKRACPPEDCGGVDEYVNVLHILADPSHKEHAEMRKWVDDTHPNGNFKPEEFDPKSLDFKPKPRRKKVVNDKEKKEAL